MKDEERRARRREPPGPAAPNATRHLVRCDLPQRSAPKKGTSLSRYDVPERRPPEKGDRPPKRDFLERRGPRKGNELSWGEGSGRRPPEKLDRPPRHGPRDGEALPGRDEGRLYGVNACLALFRRRPEALIRVYLSGKTARRFGDVMRYCAQHRLAYHLVEDHDLERITQSKHHEGVCFLVRLSPVKSVEEWLAGIPPPPATGRIPPICVVALEEVGNPHNAGAVMRVAANFGVAALCAADASVFRSASALRVAEGGAAFIDEVVFGSTGLLVAAFKKAGFCTVATSSRKGQEVYSVTLPERTLFLLGSESRGLSKQAISAADIVVRIPGTGNVESLNVATAAGILFSEFYRQHVARSSGAPTPKA